MKRQYMGDSMGKIDSDGIAQWYPNCKVRFDGSNYIATPHTSNIVKRTKRTEEQICVSVSNGKFMLENNPVKRENVTDGKEIKTNENSPSNVNDEPKSEVKHTTYKEIFNDLYDKYLYLKPKERKQAIYADMKPLFHNESDLQIFIDENCFRRWRNLIVRRQRFARKAYNQHFQYFATFTYADGKHTEESFKKRLLETLRRLASRHNWRYMGVWERGKETDRLHFHALVYIPDGEMVGKFEDVTDYNKKTGKSKTIKQNTFFAEKFGRNEFDTISDRDISYGKAIAYIMKYMEKQNTKAVYSRGLYEYFRSDIMGSDVICKMEISDETDNRLILAQDFMCIDEGVLMGKVSKETIAKMPKCV